MKHNRTYPYTGALKAREFPSRKLRKSLSQRPTSPPAAGEEGQSHSSECTTEQMLSTRIVRLARQLLDPGIALEHQLMPHPLSGRILPRECLRQVLALFGH